MDDLIQHCLRELAFEGDYGCDVQRLRGFISDFYSSHTQPVRQNVDAAFVKFAWSTLSSIPSVKIGMKPVGQHADVFVPSQPRKKDKDYGGGDGEYSGLEEIPNASTLGLAHLTEAHGQHLRVAVDSERCFVAITGSHARSGKLTPMVYAALQLVAKARDTGSSVLDLGRTLGIDQKTCFHVVKQLVELDLVVKLRRGGNSQNFCVHRFFYERSSMWREIRQATEVKVEEEKDAEPSAADNSALPSFSPMGSIHLSNLDLLRQRVVMLLKSSIDETQPYVNLCLKVGYIPQQRTDRRFFLNRLLELAKEGTIEIIHQDSSAFNIQPQKFVRFARPSTQSEVDPALAANDEESMVDGMVNDAFIGSSGLAPNKTLHRQVVDLIRGSGTAGITISELSDRLGSFDRRILSLLLSRLERLPPHHLVDLGIVQTVEFHFREKRFRYFTMDNAAQLASTLPDFELSHDLAPREAVADAGGFRKQDKKEFYEDGEELDKFYRKWDGKTQGQSRRPSMPKPPKPKKEKKPPKEKKWINPILPDGTRKRGRPLKSQRGRKKAKTEKGDAPSEDEVVEVQMDVAEAPVGSRSLKRKRSDEGGSGGSSPQSRVEETKVDVGHGQEQTDLQICDDAREFIMGDEISTVAPVLESSRDDYEANPPTKGGRGRPSKRRKAEKEPASSTQVLDPILLEPPTAEAAVVSLNEHTMTGLPAAEFVGCVSPGDDRHDDPVATEESSFPVAEKTDGATHVNVAEPLKKSLLDSLLPFEESITGRASPQAKHSARNLTALRRQNEILRVLDRCGGIVNTSGAEFLDMCKDVREAAINAGETVSAPVAATMDRRTLNYSLDKLSSQGKIKLITTTLFSSSNAQRAAKVIYLPTKSDDSVRDFIASRAMGRLPTPETRILENTDGMLNAPVAVTEEPQDPGTIARRILNLADEGERLKQLFTCDDSVIREALLSERQTVSQLYGYLPGKTARARELHLYMHSLFDEKTRQPTIVSSSLRVVDRSFFETDLPLYVYCMCFKAHHFDASFLAATRSREQRVQPLKSMPRAWHRALQTGHSKTREQIFELLYFLHGLRILTPLVECRLGDQDAMIFVDDRGVQRSLQPIQTSTPFRKSSIQPRFWMFECATSLYLYGSKLRPIPFLKKFDLETRKDLEIFYGELKSVSLSERGAGDEDNTQNQNGEGEGDEAIANILRRPSSWSTEYRLTGLQKEYLIRFVGSLPNGGSLQESDSGPTLRRLCEVSSAPLSVVQNFIEIRRHQRSRLFLGEYSRLQVNERQATATQLQLARQKLLHEAPAESTSTRRRNYSLKQERTLSHGASALATDQNNQQFAKPSTSLTGQHSLEIGIYPYLSTQILPYRFATVPAQTQHSVTTTERPIKDIIDLQKSMVFEAGDEEQTKSRKRRKNEGGKEGDAKIQRRRQRLKWTDELDELARDAQAIISVRCGNRRIEYAALDQVFPTIPHNSVRRRLSILHELPGAEAYFKRLQCAWSILWAQKRGSLELPDDDPSNLTNFNLPKHIEYLRKHISKAAIRVGVSSDSLSGHHTMLYGDPDAFAQDWHLEERGTMRAKPEFLLDTYTTEEAREKAFCDFVVAHAHGQDNRSTFASDSDLFTEAVLKLVVGSPDRGFDSSAAAEALQKIGDDRVEKAMDKLLSENVLSRVSRDSSRLGPGRSVKIAEPNLNALEGPLPKDIFEKAQEVEESFSEDIEGAQTWPFVATEGETAAILQMVSDHAVDFSFDCSTACKARKQVENSRKADDDDIELGIQVSVDLEKIFVSAEEELPLAPHRKDEYNSKHGITVSGAGASCKFSGIGVVDCSECVENMTTHLLSGLGEGDDTVRAILDIINIAGEGGLTASDIRSSLSTIDSTIVDTLLHGLHMGLNPLIHVVGYNSPTFLSSKHVGSRTITSMDDEVALIKFFPRRWIDLRGKRVHDVWEIALRAVAGEILLNPGTSQFHLKSRFRYIYDRAELVDVLGYLNGNGFIYYKAAEIARPCIECLDPEEERDVFWFVNGEKRWYDL